LPILLSGVIMGRKKFLLMKIALLCSNPGDLLAIFRDAGHRTDSVNITRYRTLIEIRDKIKKIDPDILVVEHNLGLACTGQDVVIALNLPARRCLGVQDPRDSSSQHVYCQEVFPYKNALGFSGMTEMLLEMLSKLQLKPE
jgi:hypothetical protein